jgi:hypothetical protein
MNPVQLCPKSRFLDITLFGHNCTGFISDLFPVWVRKGLWNLQLICRFLAFNHILRDSDARHSHGGYENTQSSIIDTRFNISETSTQTNPTPLIEDCVDIYRKDGSRRELRWQVLSSILRSSLHSKIHLYCYTRPRRPRRRRGSSSRGLRDAQS